MNIFDYYPARCYNKSGKAFETGIYATSWTEAAKFCKQRGWIMEESAARKNPGFAELS